MTPFELVKNLQSKDKYLEDDELQGYSKWMVNKILACDPQLVHLIAEINTMDCTPREHYDICWYAVPKSKKFIQYLLKKPKAEKDIVHLMTYFGCSQAVAKQYLELITPDELKYIVDVYEKQGVKK